MTLDAVIAANLRAVRARIAAAARRVDAGPGRHHARSRFPRRSPPITSGPPSRPASAISARTRSRKRLQKIARNGRISRCRWHLIGHLQSNKAKKAAAPFASSTRSTRSISSAGSTRPRPKPGARPTCWCRWTWPARTTKFGAPADAARRIVDAALEAQAARSGRPDAAPPWNEDQEQTRPWFRRLRELRAGWSRRRPGDALRHLSMGMSHDFEAAIEEGATMVRVGTAIFGKRTPSTP